jgi:hypothetical protein
MAQIERKKIAKAPEVDTVVALTSVGQQAAPPAPVNAPVAATAAAEREETVPAAAVEAAAPKAMPGSAAASQPRRPVGRPRGRTIRIAYSTKLEVELEDRLRRFSHERGEAQVDIIEEALNNFFEKERFE